MNEKIKTISFVAVAIFLAIAALVTHFVTQPRSLTELESVGQPFYTNFTDPTQAESLEVSARNELGEIKSFVVKKIEGEWRIPSHHGYPAEATERLVETATALLGIRRESNVGRMENEHERFGVLDPRSASVAGNSGVGKRITLLDGEKNVLLDLIVGDPVKREVETEGFGPKMADPEFANHFYVRRPDEPQTFQAKVDLDISTDFNDWIEPDLLKIGEQQVMKVVLDNYRLVEKTFQTSFGVAVQYQREPGEIIQLNRDPESLDWSLDGLDEATEQLNTFKAADIAAHLQDVEIKGVRKKFSFQGEQILLPDLTLNIPNSLRQNPQQAQQVIQELQSDLLDKGFDIARDPNDEKLVLASSRGELSASTSDGVVYTLNFGEVFVGDETAIQIGRSKDSADESDEEKTSDDSKDDSEESSEDGAEVETDDDKPRSRFLMVRVAFDENLVKMPLAPIVPIEPTKPEGYDEWNEKQIEKELKGEMDDSENDPSSDGKSEDDEKSEKDEETGEGDQDSEGPPTPPEDVTEEMKAQEAQYRKYKNDLLEYLIQQNQYEESKANHAEELKQYHKTVRRGRRLVRQLNNRFAEWYYVIADSSFEKLQAQRSDLVAEKPEETDTSLDPNGGAGNPLSNDTTPNPDSESLSKRPNIDFSSENGEQSSDPENENEKPEIKKD